MKLLKKTANHRNRLYNPSILVMGCPFPSTLTKRTVLCRRIVRRIHFLFLHSCIIRLFTIHPADSVSVADETYSIIIKLTVLNVNYCNKKESTPLKPHLVMVVYSSYTKEIFLPPFYERLTNSLRKISTVMNQKNA